MAYDFTENDLLNSNTLWDNPVVDFSAGTRGLAVDVDQAAVAETHVGAPQIAECGCCACSTAAQDNQLLSGENSTLSTANPVEAVQGTVPLLGGGGTVYYYLGGVGYTGSISGRVGEENWSTQEINIVNQAMNDIEELININLVRTTNSSLADLEIIKNDNNSFLGSAPGATVGGVWKADITINHTINNRWTLGKEKGGQGYETLVHEIGHTLGLGHTHDTGFGSDTLQGMSFSNRFTLGPDGINDPINSIMAYNDGWFAEGTSSLTHGNRANFGAWDVKALQNRYGANTSTNTGSDTYTLPSTNATGTYFETIWDNGGTDTISAAGATLDAVIDLTAATLDISATTGGPVNHLVDGSGNTIRGGFTIANGVVIENATGGNGDDSITGNSANNVIEGGAGNDNMKGLGGNDTFIIRNGHAAATTAELYDGGTGTDKIQLRGAGTYDMDQFNVLSIEELEFYADGSNVDKIFMMDNKELDSTSEFATALLIDGNANTGSDDTIMIDVSFSLNLDISGWTFQDWNTASGQTDRIIINGDGDDSTITTTSQIDEINAGAGADIVNAGAGDDIITDTQFMTPGTENDVYDGGAGVDTLVHNLNWNGSVEFNLATGFATVAGSNRDQLINIENLTVGGSASMVGSSVDNVLIALGTGANEINAGAGNDTVDAGGGDDIITDTETMGALNDDVYDGGTGVDTLVHNFNWVSTVEFNLASGFVTLNGSNRDQLINIENLTVGGSASMVGSSVDNVLIALGTGANEINAGAGNDTVDAGGGDDIITDTETMGALNDDV
ncbi:MAG: M10 family metallopeptidase C-terminal domain-containing protein, partial [bacterium]